MKVKVLDNGCHDEERKLKVVHIVGGMMATDYMGPAFDQLAETGVDIRAVSTTSELLDSDAEAMAGVLDFAEEADFIIVNVHSDPSHFGNIDKLSNIASREKIPFFLFCNNKEPMEEYRDFALLNDEEYSLVSKYIELSGEANCQSVLIWACNRFAGTDLPVPEPHVEAPQGIYGTELPEEEFLLSIDPGRPCVGVLFPALYNVQNNTGYVDALISGMRSLGTQVVPVYFTSTPSETSGSLGILGVIERYFMRDGAPIVGSVVFATGFSQLSLCGRDIQEAKVILKSFDIPLVQAPNILRSRKDWEEDTVGMTTIELSTNIYQPEFDGQIISAPLSFRERDADGIFRMVTVDDRVRRIAELATAWARLRLKPIGEVRAFIMLNMYPPSNDRLGGAGGLDTFESIRLFMQRLADSGFKLDKVPETSREIVDELLAGLTPDMEWVPPEQIPGRAADMIELRQYLDWLDAEPEKVRTAICRNWGDPPGELSVLGDRMIVHGVRNGNLFIGIQPNRGHHANAEQYYHSADSVTPHQYLGYYRWIRDVFKADILIHMGTHGTLEWLPGKGNGLSRCCYPDAVLDSIPNVYPYIIDDPGEGMEAKRRTDSVLIGYMVASMTRADSYEEMADLDAALQMYLNSNTGEKKEGLLDTIYGCLSELDLWKEIGLEPGAPKEEVAGMVDSLYDYICDLKDAVIKDGLHILGKVPEGKRMEEMVYSMTRLRNGEVPSLRKSVAAAKGLDLDALLDSPSACTGGRLNGAWVDEIDRECCGMISDIIASGFDRERSPPSDGGAMGTIMDFICGPLRYGITHISDERDNLLGGMTGGYVPPGPSGSPTRGNAHLLPTGTNYFSIDPYAIPNASSWDIGVKMADAMLDKYVEDNGKYPENVAIVVWATDTMKTGGDDIAYILYLLGLRPRYSSYGGRVVGLDVIPLEELGRPRVDMTLRISGMFRDSFPNLVELIDGGVEMVSELDEGDESNFLRKHLREDMAKRISEGLSEQEARDRSLIRIFGDPPGQHGCGTGILIESSKWETIEDLAQVYTVWGAYAYGRGWKGEKVEKEFIDRMSAQDVTVKNHNDREFDLLDIDDDYEVLGGLNAVVRAYGKHKPATYMGDSSDTDRLKLRSLEEETAYVMRSRVLNPRWFEGLKPHGFRGAMELSKLTEYMLGWDATSDNIEPWMYKAVTEKYVLDDENRKWIEENNPYAMHEMIDDLLEAIDRDLWDAPEEIRERLRDLYLESEGLLEMLNNDERGRS